MTAAEIIKSSSNILPFQIHKKFSAVLQNTFFHQNFCPSCKRIYRDPLALQRIGNKNGRFFPTSRSLLSCVWISTSHYYISLLSRFGNIDDKYRHPNDNTEIIQLAINYIWIGCNVLPVDLISDINVYQQQRIIFVTDLSRLENQLDC